MLINAKINLKKYIILSLSLLGMSYFSTQSIDEYGVILLVFIATCINHWMLIKSVRSLSEQAASGESKKAGLSGIMIIGKLIVVAAALTFGVQIMGKRIIIPVLIYVLQILVLYLSFEKTTGDSTGS